ncbi:hypothetical protein [Paraburkholderia sp. BCC1886]|uniref:hypothetical protein n=1 Tax=Paraburkholderia sp. BCC1886 TaxID=2562670 RepID=UPI001183DF58|nr:hypothetical protein [Paraburkholderia sp. BCC1886]
MLLFESDWLKYPNAIIDTKTSNQSYVRLVMLYKKMGIKNHAFPLALLNPRLQGVDPFAPDLTREEMIMIAVECANNCWYYMREVARVPAIGGGDATQFEGNRGNVALFWCFFNHVMTFLIQIRQTGKSLSTDLLMSLLLNIVCERTEINLLTKDEILRKTNIDRLKKCIDELPGYLQQRNPKVDTNNSEAITVNSRFNIYKTHVPQASEKGAYKLGRGLTSPIMHIDEGPFQPNVKIAVGSALAATGAAVDKVKANGGQYGTIFTTTAGKIDDKDGSFIYGLLQAAAIWTERFFDARDAEELEHMIRKASRGEGGGVYRVNITLNHRQLGKTDQWLRGKIEESTSSGDDANRDFFNMWTAGSLTNPIPIAVLKAISNSVKDVKHTEISPEGYTTRWYIEEEEIEQRMLDSQFVLGMDTSNASGGDDISLILVDVETLEVVAAGTYNETNLITFCQWFSRWFVRWENFTAVIENRSTGVAVLDFLCLMLPEHGIDPFRRLFSKVVQEYDEYPERFKEISVPMGRRNRDVYARLKKLFGFSTSGGSGLTSRSELYSTTLQLAAKRACSMVHDKALIDQITSLISKNGRIDHPSGGHDDLVIGWLLVHFLLTRGKQLSFYGIDQRRIGAALGGQTEETIMDREQRQEQQQVLEAMEALYEELSREDNEWIIMKLEHQLRLLDKQRVAEVDETFSLDTLIAKSREKRRERLRRETNRMAGHNLSNNLHGSFSDRLPTSMSQYERRFVRQAA